MTYTQTLADAGQVMLDANQTHRRLEDGNDTGTAIYHGLNSLLTWCDVHKVDFDAILSDLRADLQAERQGKA